MKKMIVPLKASLLMAAIAAAITQGACTKESSGNKVDAAGITADQSLSTTDKAERLAEAAERLLPTGAFLYAEDVVESALLLDPANPRARLIHAVLAPTMELQGILARIEPLVKTQPEQYEKFAAMVADFKHDNPEKSVTHFLTDGAADIHTEREAQEVLARVTVRFDELRQTLRSLRDTELVLHFNPQDYQNGMPSNCLATQTAPHVYQLQNCSPADAYERRANGADFEALEEVVAGYQVYLTMLNAYDLTGLYTKTSYATGDFQHGLNELFKNPEFGTLRETNGLGVIPDMARDAVLGVRRAQALQAELCPHGEGAIDNRPGYLFNAGFCVTSSTTLERTLSGLELMLRGQAVALPLMPGNPDMHVNALKAFTQPVQNLRTLQPTLNACGQIAQIADPTLGGVFPDGDFNRLLIDNCQASR